MYDYFVKPTKCFGNISGLSKYDVCYTQAELDAGKAQDKALLSALGDMTFVVPYIRCLKSNGENEHECDTVGEAFSTWDVGALESGGGRFIRELLMARKVFCSFSSDTPVLMKNGKTKPIGKVKPGDKVAAADPKTGKRQGDRTVTAQLEHHDDDLLDLTIRDAAGTRATLHTAAGHPFWDDTLHVWVPAGHFTPEHELATVDNGHVRVVGITARPGGATMYNLTIQQLHTYYVVAGDAPVLVHNEGCGPVSYGSTDLSQAAIAFQKANRVGSGQNIAVYRVEMPDGS